MGAALFYLAVYTLAPLNSSVRSPLDYIENQAYNGIDRVAKLLDISEILRRKKV